MYITYPNGTVVHYPRVRYYQFNSFQGAPVLAELFDRKDGRRLGIVSSASGAILSFDRPFIHPASSRGELTRLLQDESQVEQLPGHVLAQLKRKLRGFDARDYCWTV